MEKNENIIMNPTFKAKNIKLAEYRYFSLERQTAATHIDELNRVFVLLYQDGDHYYNLITHESLPIYGRSPYSDVFSNGEDHGNQLRLVNGMITDGFCYVLCPDPVVFKDRDEVSLVDILYYMLDDERFFKDRLELLKENIAPVHYNTKMNVLIRDPQRLNEFYHFLEESGIMREQKKQKKK